MKKSIIFIVFAFIIMTEASSHPCLPDGIIFSNQTQIDTFIVNSHSGFKVIYTQMWKPGAYVVSLVSQDKLIGTKTILVSK